MAADIGLTVYKVAMTWPLEREGIRRFAQGLEEIVVVEEKRALIENQLKEQLYNWDPDVRPRVIGKFDEEAHELLPAYNELSPARIAVTIGRRLLKFFDHEGIRRRVEFLDRQENAKTRKALVERKPFFCSGCPHNTSTVVPEGSRAVAGIGCHYMATWMDRRTETFTQMGGEGVPWIGQAPFTDEQHIFANLGDGTYFHSGMLAVRAAIAAGVNITYKILYNDAVAMTGGQAHDGSLSVPQISRQLAAEGATRIVVVTDEPEKYAGTTGLAAGVRVEHRDDLDSVQRELREVKGTSILIYDQTCAAEKRRRRKRKIMVDPPKRVMINEQVCEGCGDCSKKSNCLSVVPVETEFGRKRQIDQSSCNKDFSCVKGFCPSFVTVHGGQLRKPKPAAAAGTAAVAEIALPEPALPGLDHPYGVLVTGIGGTGVVTIGAILGMAAHIEGKGCSVLDQAGLAQKGEPSPAISASPDKPDDIHAVRVAAGGAHLVIGCDVVVTASSDCLSKMAPGFTQAVINDHETVTADFTRNADFRIPSKELQAEIAKACGGAEALTSMDATGIATALMGDSHRDQPVHAGRRLSEGPDPGDGRSDRTGDRAERRRGQDEHGCLPLGPPRRRRPGRRQGDRRTGRRRAASELSETLDEVIARRVQLPDRLPGRGLCRPLQEPDRLGPPDRGRARPWSTGLTEAVARNYFKLLAYKDEYEVARLYTDGTFLKRLSEQFEGDYKLEFHLAPPMLAETDPATGEPKKKAYGPWMLKAFQVLARMKRLRGTRFDPFGRTPERKMERQLIADYEKTLGELLSGLNHENHGLAVQIASIPDAIRGFGPVKERHLADARAKEAALLEAFRHPAPTPMAAE